MYVHGNQVTRTTDHGPQTTDDNNTLTLAGAWAGGTEYGVNLVLLNKIVCFVFTYVSHRSHLSFFR